MRRTVTAATLLTLSLFLLLAWEMATAQNEPEAFTVLRESGSRTGYFWWDASGSRPYQGEIRFTACIGGTLRVEHWLSTGAGWQFWQTYFVVLSKPVAEADDLPRLERAGETCILKISNGIHFRKSLISRRIYLPLFLDRSEP